MTKLRIASDLHTEFHTYKIPASNNGRDFHTNMMLPIMENEKEQILILAGDICLAKNVPTLFFRDLSERFKHIIVIAGNHESYRGNIRMTTMLMQEGLKQFENITFLENEVFIVDDIIFCGATLWTSFYNNDPFVMGKSMGYAKQSMSDFQIIGYGAVDCPTHLLPTWTPELSAVYHTESMDFIQEVLDYKGNRKTVIITHHGISQLSCDPKYAGNPLNPAFYSELDSFIMHYQPNIWIHGHTHSSHRYKIGKTEIIVNPKGYGLHPSENANYNPMLVVEI